MISGQFRFLNSVLPAFLVNPEPEAKIEKLHVIGTHYRYLACQIFTWYGTFRIGNIANIRYLLFSTVSKTSLRTVDISKIWLRVWQLYSKFILTHLICLFFSKVILIYV